MPGFLSEYSGIETVTFGEYWAKVHKYLARQDYRAASDVLVAPVMRSRQDDEADKSTTETTGDVDSSGYQNEALARALVDWNFTDEDGNPIPLGDVHPEKGPDAVRYAAVNRLPQVVFEKLIEPIDDLKRSARNKKAVAAEEAAFQETRQPRVIRGGRASR